MRIFIDTNVLIDVLEKRIPFYLYSANVLNLGATGEHELYATPLSLVNCIYICRKSQGYEKALDSIKQVRRIVRVAPMSEAEFDTALSCMGSDLEDNLQYASALASSCDVIVTRNKEDYKSSDIPVLTPRELMG